MARRCCQRLWLALVGLEFVPSLVIRRPPSPKLACLFLTKGKGRNGTRKRVARLSSLGISLLWVLPFRVREEGNERRPLATFLRRVSTAARSTFYCPPPAQVSPASSCHPIHHPVCPSASSSPSSPEKNTHAGEKEREDKSEQHLASLLVLGRVCVSSVYVCVCVRACVSCAGSPVVRPDDPANNRSEQAE